MSELKRELLLAGHTFFQLFARELLRERPVMNNPLPICLYWFLYRGIRIKGFESRSSRVNTSDIVIIRRRIGSSTLIHPRFDTRLCRRTVDAEILSENF